MSSHSARHGSIQSVHGIHFVTDPNLTSRHGLLPTVDAAVRAGVAVVQVRDKEASARKLLATLTAVADVVRGRCLLLLDDRTDIVAAARLAGTQVDGVHLGQSDLPAVSARQMLGLDTVIGLTANAPEHLADLATVPVGTIDYLGVGVIRPTTTKLDHPTPLGISGFGNMAALTDLPCIAIGGVTADDLPRVAAVGGAGAAVVSEICLADDPGHAAERLVQRWARAVTS